MATNVEGRTVHSWGEVGFIKGGQYISSGNKDRRDLDSMVTKCQKLRFVLIDEVENLGALCLADLESNVTRGMPEEPYKWKVNEAGHQVRRLFGGCNVTLVGDFWQLDPVREIALMKNPFRGAATMSERAQKMLSIFWSAGPDTLSRPVFELTVNIRCGEDEW